MGGSSSPCASCKLLRRRCTKDCIFAPYFPPNEPHKFAIVHKVFGASNISKMLQELPIQQRADAVNSLVYEANARMRDPVYGCVGAISFLQNQISQLEMQLAMAQAEILCIQMQN
ncbi:LOB domain-containing protein 12, partial [Solanum verrucosum]